MYIWNNQNIESRNLEIKIRDELGVDQLSAYRIYQFSQIFRVKVKYFFDTTYIDRMNGYHTKVFHAAMPSDLLDIDQLEVDAAEDMDQAEVQATL